jgi:hypothetical protein
MNKTIRKDILLHQNRQQKCNTNRKNRPDYRKRSNVSVKLKIVKTMQKC